MAFPVVEGKTVAPKDLMPQRPQSKTGELI